MKPTEPSAYIAFTPPEWAEPKWEVVLFIAWTLLVCRGKPHPQPSGSELEQEPSAIVAVPTVGPAKIISGSRVEVLGCRRKRLEGTHFSATTIVLLVPSVIFSVATSSSRSHICRVVLRFVVGVFILPICTLDYTAILNWFPRDRPALEQGLSQAALRSATKATPENIVAHCRIRTQSQFHIAQVGVERGVAYLRVREDWLLHPHNPPMKYSPGPIVGRRRDGQL